MNILTGSDSYEKKKRDGKVPAVTGVELFRKFRKSLTGLSVGESFNGYDKDENQDRKIC